MTLPCRLLERTSLFQLLTPLGLISSRPVFKSQGQRQTMQTMNTSPSKDGVLLGATVRASNVESMKIDDDARFW